MVAKVNSGGLNGYSAGITQWILYVPFSYGEFDGPFTSMIQRFALDLSYSTLTPTGGLVVSCLYSVNKRFWFFPSAIFDLETSIFNKINNFYVKNYCFY